jgi:NitT/TauT family transport system substrate-binding protein
MADMPTVRIAPNNPLFDLPVLVGIEHGTFKRHGLDVKLSAKYEDREATLRTQEPMLRMKENMLDCGTADGYSVCEWATIDRIERGQKANVAALRACVAAQAILSYDDTLQAPRDLKDVPVVVNEFTGSHYTTLGMLEGPVGQGHVKIEHIGAPWARWEALRDRTHRAVTLMEPFISLALREGAHIIAAEFYRGGDMISNNLTSEQRRSFLDAENEAVDLINKDFYKNAAPHIVSAARGLMKPQELLRAFVHYKKVDFYDPAKFDQTYDFLKRWGLTRGMNKHEAFVAVG